MNKEKRRRLNDADILIKEAVRVISDVKDDEENSFYNLPEGLQNAQRGMDMQDAIDQMDEIIEVLEDVSSDLGALSI